VIRTRNEDAECERVALEILTEHLRTQRPYSDFAILYRGNYQAKLMELKLQHHQIPYRLSGGTSFFARQEVKDLMSYFRLLVNPDDVAYGQFVPEATTRAWLLRTLPDEPDPLVRATGTAALFEAVREAELDPAQFADVALRLLAKERDPDTHGVLLDLLATAALRYLPTERSAPLLQRATDLLLAQLRDEADSGRELSTFRFLARASTDARVLLLCRAVVGGKELPKGLVVGKQDAFLAAAAMLAVGDAGVEAAFTALGERFAGEDLGKERFLARAAAPTAAGKQEHFAAYLQLEQPPEQWMARHQTTAPTEAPRR
jgi:hypothetical protein